MRSRRLPWTALRVDRSAHPAEALIGRLPESFGELSGMVLDVAQIEELMLQLGHRVPGEAALGRRQVEPIDGGIDHGLTMEAVGSDVSHRIGGHRGGSIGPRAETVVA